MIQMPFGVLTSKPHAAKNEIGKVYGRLTVIRGTSKPRGGQNGIYWLCQCECGELSTVHGKHLRSGSTISCGCLRTEINQEFNAGRQRKYGRAAARAFFTDYRSRARRREIPFNFTEEQLLAIGKQGCHYCGCPPDREYNPNDKYHGGYRTNGIDRLDSAGDYSVENCVPCCTQCNFAKGTMPAEIFRNHIRAIYHHWAKEGAQP